MARIPPRVGTPGGGSGGAIYNDGNTYILTIAGTVMTNNNANEGGGAIFYVSNDRTGTMSIDQLDAHAQQERQVPELPRHLLPRRARTDVQSLHDQITPLLDIPLPMAPRGYRYASVRV